MFGFLGFICFFWFGIGGFLGGEKSPVLGRATAKFERQQRHGHCF